MGVWRDPVFVISAITLFAGVLKIGFTFLYRSKCENFTMCWGLVNIHRNIQLENDADRADAEVIQRHAEV